MEKAYAGTLYDDGVLLVLTAAVAMELGVMEQRLLIF